MERAILEAVARVDMALCGYGGWVCLAVALVLATVMMLLAWKE